MKEKFKALIIKEKNLLILSLVFSIVVFIVYVIFIYKPTYVSSAKIFIRDIPKQNFIADLDGISVMKSENGYSNPLFNFAQIVNSKNISTRVLNSVKQKYPKDFKKINIKNEDEWHNYFKKMLKTKIIPSSDIMTISLNWSNKNNTGSLLEETIKQLRLENLNFMRTAQIKQREFLDKNLIDISQELSDIRQEIKNYRLINNVVDVNVEKAELIRTRVEFEKEAKSVRSQIRYFDRKIVDLAQQLGVPDVKTALRSTAIGDDAYLEEVSKTLATAQQRYANLIGKFTDNYPEVISVKNEINSLKNNIQKRKKESLQNIIVARGIYDKPSQEIVTDLARAQAEKISLNAQLNEMQKEINNMHTKEATLPEKILGIEELQKQEEAFKSAYDNIKRKQLEAIIKENEIVDNIFVLDSPSRATPVFNGIIFKFLGLIYLGFIGGLSIAWVKDSSKNNTNFSGIKNNFQKIINIGQLPWVNLDTFEEKYFNDSESELGAAYINSASIISSKAEKENIHFISFLSLDNNRGNCRVIANIAAGLSRKNHSVILIGSDYNCCNNFIKHTGISLLKKKDMIETIDNINKYINIFKRLSPQDIKRNLYNSIIKIKFNSNTSFQGFDYIHLGQDNKNLFDYIASNGFQELINYFRLEYEFILIDIPPKNQFTHLVSAIISKSDATVIISGKNIPEKEIKDSILNLEHSGSKILGVISREKGTDPSEYINAERF